MPPVTRFPGTSPLTIAWFVYRLWRRLPPAQRRQALSLACTHGPRLAALAARQARSRWPRP